LFYHHAYYHSHHAAGFIDMIVSTVTHALIWGFVYKLMRAVDLPSGAVIVLIGLVCAYFFWRRRA
jgi:hypothetical protein